MFCTKCGLKNDDDALFCAGCGSVLKAPQSAANENSGVFNNANEETKNEEVKEETKIEEVVSEIPEDVINEAAESAKEEVKIEDVKPQEDIPIQNFEQTQEFVASQESLRMQSYAKKQEFTESQGFGQSQFNESPYLNPQPQNNKSGFSVKRFIFSALIIIASIAACAGIVFTYVGMEISAKVEGEKQVDKNYVKGYKIIKEKVEMSDETGDLEEYEVFEDVTETAKLFRVMVIVFEVVLVVTTIIG